MKNKLIKAGALTILAPVMVGSVAMADEVNSSENINHNDVQTRMINSETNRLGIINVRTGTNLNIRKLNGTNNEVIGKIPSGKTVSILGETTDGWYKVRYNNIEGYSSSEYIKIIGSNEVSTENSMAFNGKVKNMSARLNVRAKSNTSSEIIDRLSSGQVVKIVAQTSNGWYKVEVNNKVGYVSGNYIVRTNEQVSQVQDNSSKIGKIATVNTTALNVRSGSGISNPVVNKVYKNNNVKILDVDSNGWMKVQLSTGVNGWVNGKYLTNFKEGSLNSATSNQVPNQSVTESTQSNSSSKVQSVINLATSKLGCAYQWGAEGPNSFDCSGLVYYTYKNAANIVLPRTSSAQASAGYQVSKSNLKAGDLVFFNTNGKGISHVGIYLGNGDMIHSPNSNSVVKKVSINSGYYASRFVTARRIIG